MTLSDLVPDSAAGAGGQASARGNRLQPVIPISDIAITAPEIPCLIFMTDSLWPVRRASALGVTMRSLCCGSV